jgi:hypothetical protein
VTKPMEKLREIDRNNVEAAEIVLSEPERYKPGGLMAKWARRVLARAEKAE